MTAGAKAHLPLPGASAADLRELFAAPERVAAALDSASLERALGLARDLAQAPRAGLWLSGSAASVGDLALEPRLVAQARDAERPGEGRVLEAPLLVALAPSGEGPARPYGVVAVGPLARSGDALVLARHVSTLLLERALARRAEVDRTTGLWARPALERRLPELTERIARGERLAVALLDVDGLREVNARSGRPAGDSVLRGLGVAAGLAAGEGHAGRWGSDEVLLLFPGKTADEARAALALLREGLAATCPGTTVSAGIAAAPEHASEAEALVHDADQALAHAKASGRGGDAVWSPSLRGMRGRDRLAGVLSGIPARDYRNVQALLDTVDDVAQLAPLRETLARLIDRVLDVTGAERGLVLLRKGDRFVVEVARGRGGRALPGSATFAASIAEEALGSARAIERLADENAPISPSADTIGVETVLCAPLSGRDVPSGVVYVDSREPGRFDAPTLALFSALTSAVGTALRNAALYDALVERSARLASDVRGREEELVRVRRQWASVARETAGDYEGLVGSSPAMTELVTMLRSLEGTTASIVIEGESGTGKELVARAIHQRSPRREGPLVAVNCGAIPGTLFESELFGHARGAFTGAHAERQGLVEMAHQGTLFLDELGELPLEAQAKLLRFLESGEVRRVGEDTVRNVSVRVVAATNRDLRAEVARGAFREDLYYRLAVFRVRVPSLRERPQDVPPLVAHMLRALGKPDVQVLPDAAKELVKRRWAGNVRELRNVVERALALAGPGPIAVSHLAPEDSTPRAAGDDALLELDLADARAIFTLRYVKAAVERAGGSVKDAAKKAGVSKQTLYRALEEGERAAERHPQA